MENNEMNQNNNQQVNNNSYQPIKDNSNKGNSNGLMLIIIILLLVLIGVMLYVFVFNKKDDNKQNNNNQSNTNQNIKQQENNNQSVDNNIKYENYTSADDLTTSIKDKNMSLVIENGKLKASIDNKQLDVSGIDGKAKSFIYGGYCGGEMAVLVITEDNKLFQYEYDINITTGPNGEKTGGLDYNSKLTFEKVNLNEEIKDITKHVEAGFTTCGEYYFSVVLKNGEIRTLEYVDGNPVIGKLDYRLIKDRIESIIIYSDNTISKWLSDKNNGPIEEKIKNNNKDLIIEKLFSIYDKDYKEEIYYVVSDNKLYKLQVIRKEDEIEINKINVSLVNNSAIKEETLKINKGKNEYGVDQTGSDDIRNVKTNTVTFADGSKEVIENINYAYSIK